jgi:hypothetical protein
LTSSLSVARTGSQLPRIESYPLFATSAGDDAIDLAALAGLVLDPWQEYVLRCSLGEKPNGKWTAFRCALVVPRQNGKNALLEARELAGMFLFGEKRIIHTAHEVKTARESMMALMNRMKASDHLMEQVAGFEGDFDKDFSGMKTGNDPSITLKNGNKLSYAARSKGSGRGFTGDLIILDEAYALRADEMAAMVPTMAARSMVGNPQLWFTSSAGMPESDLLNSIREEGKARSSERLAYFEWSAADDTDFNDVDAWYEANPGLGIRISEQYVMDELETMLSDPGEGEEKFKRERLGIWAKLGGESVFPTGLWAGLADESADRGDRAMLVLDVTPNRDSASIMAVSVNSAGKIHVEVAESMTGTSWVADSLPKLVAEYSAYEVVAVAGSAAEPLLPALRSSGTRVRLIRFAEYMRACGSFFDAVVQRRVVHLADPILDDAVEAAKQSWSRDGASWYWSRKSTAENISPLIGATIGVALVEQRASKPRERKVVIL